MERVKSMRAWLILGSVVVALAGCDPRQAPPPSEDVTPPTIEIDVGELHNEGARYVLARLSHSAGEEERQQQIRTLVSDWCRGEGLPQCESLATVPDEPSDWASTVGASSASPAYKARLSTLGEELARVRSLDDVHGATTRALAAGEEGLREGEFAQLSRVASIAEASAVLWAPRELGGEDAGAGLPELQEGSAYLTWPEIMQADALGCAADFSDGCVHHSVLWSVGAATRRRAV